MPDAPLGEFEVTVLLAIATLGEDAYGLRVRREVSALAGRDYSVGAIYTTLKRLEHKGMLESWTTEPLPVRGGRSRRHFRMTPSGRRMLSDARQRASRLWSAVDLRLKPA